MNVKETLEKLLTAIAQEAGLHNTPLEQKLDAAKVMTAYYALELKRLKGATEDDDPDEPTMENLASVIHQEGPNGRTAARIRNRS